MEKFINKKRYRKQYQILNKVLDILNTNYIFYVPVGGTILGLYRDKCILPYDDDFDFLITKKDKKIIIDLMEKNNFCIHYYNWGDAFAIRCKGISFDDDKYVFIDFFVAESKNKLLISSHDKIKCNDQCIIKKSFYKIPSITFMCDIHIEDYLNNKYKNWKNSYIIWNHHTDGKVCLNEKPNLLEISKNILEKFNIITFGTFDLFHIGHLNIFKYCKKKYPKSKLFVGVSSDNFNYIKKKIYPQINEKDRIEIIKAIKYVDYVFLEESYEKKLEYCEKYDIDILIMGDDHLGKFDFLNKNNIKTEYKKRTENISTTIIKKNINF